ncbi:MAG: pyruvate formate lyase-activating protein, partial [Candidatus Odinarchaeota archaeon]
MVFRILRPDSVSVWQNKEILSRFSKYRSIIDGKRYARYLIAKTIECIFNPSDSIKNLENLLKEKSNEFNELLIKDQEQLKNRVVQVNNYITLAENIAIKYLKSCIFCERQCEANRINGEKGFCLISKDSYVSSAFLHMGEEPHLIPSGTIFFQGCNFGCVFCQNYDISQAW